MPRSRDAGSEPLASDLWNPAGPLPETINDVLFRAKQIARRLGLALALFLFFLADLVHCDGRCRSWRVDAIAVAMSAEPAVQQVQRRWFWLASAHGSG